MTNEQQTEPCHCNPAWASWPDEKLLDLPMCRLNVSIKSPFLCRQIQKLNHELEAKRLNFRPHFWISNEWFTPDGVPGIAIPFYLAISPIRASKSLSCLRCSRSKEERRTGA
jgi:hypothetical protein